MPTYDSSLFTPPAPVTRVTLRNPENNAILSDVPMLLDTGADVTLIPQASVNLIGVSITPNEGYELMGFNGSRSIAKVAQLDLLFLHKAFKGRFLLINQECGILGRDILNHLSLLFDGPNQVWDEHRLTVK